MITYEVTNRDEFAAALSAASCISKTEAIKNPFQIILLNTTFVFKAPQGLEHHKAKGYIRRVKRSHRDAFTALAI
jgi:hypothetical protein